MNRVKGIYSLEEEKEKPPLNYTAGREDIFYTAVTPSMHTITHSRFVLVLTPCHHYWALEQGPNPPIALECCITLTPSFILQRARLHLTVTRLMVKLFLLVNKQRV